jgi:hypothetical protein
MIDQFKFDRLEAAMAAIKSDRELWQAYQDADKDKDVLAGMNARNPSIVSDEEVEAAKAKACDLMSAWHDNRKAARVALDALMEPYGMTRRDLNGLCG